MGSLSRACPYSTCSFVTRCYSYTLYVYSVHDSLWVFKFLVPFKLETKMGWRNGEFVKDGQPNLNHSLEKQINQGRSAQFTIHERVSVLDYPKMKTLIVVWIDLSRRRGMAGELESIISSDADVQEWLATGYRGWIGFNRANWIRTATDEYKPRWRVDREPNAIRK